MPPCPLCHMDHAGAACPAQRTQRAGSLGAAPTLPPPPAAVALAAGEIQPGTTVGNYRVVRKLGEGGMGMVYEAVHETINKRAAIKVLNAVGSQSREAAERFLQEARATGLLQHRNIISTFDYGQLPDGRAYLAMEFLLGESLEVHLRRHGPLSYAQALPILNGILAGLKAAHDKGIVHRDLKPENIWICPDEDGGVDASAVKILDFGLAKLQSAGEGDARLTRAGAPMGTPAFMSPEQCRGLREIDHRTDIYALGVIMWEVFTLRVPFQGPSFLDVMNMHLHTPPPDLRELCRMPADLAAVVHKALAKDPALRFQSVAELRAGLGQCEDALHWEPERPAPGSAPTAPPDAPTLPPTPEGGEGAGEGDEGAEEDAALAPFAGGGLEIVPRPTPEALTLEFDGDWDEGDGAAIDAYLLGVAEALEAGAVPGQPERVVLDVERLHYIEMAGILSLCQFLERLRGLRRDGLAPTLLRYREEVPAQRSLLLRLQRTDPALAAEGR